MKTNGYKWILGVLVWVFTLYVTWNTAAAGIQDKVNTGIQEAMQARFQDQNSQFDEIKSHLAIIDRKLDEIMLRPEYKGD